MTGICSTGNVEAVKALGADKVIDYKTEKVADAVKGLEFDIILDCVGGDEYYFDCEPSLKRGGVFSTAVGMEMHIEDGPVTANCY